MRRLQLLSDEDPGDLPPRCETCGELLDENHRILDKAGALGLVTQYGRSGVRRRMAFAPMPEEVIQYSGPFDLNVLQLWGHTWPTIRWLLLDPFGHGALVRAPWAAEFRANTPNIELLAVAKMWRGGVLATDTHGKRVVMYASIEYANWEQ